MKVQSESNRHLSVPLRSVPPPEPPPSRLERYGGELLCAVLVGGVVGMVTLVGFGLGRLVRWWMGW